jgi:hypothetical protein
MAQALGVLGRKRGLSYIGRGASVRFRCGLLARGQASV